MNKQNNMYWRILFTAVFAGLSATCVLLWFKLPHWSLILTAPLSLVFLLLAVICCFQPTREQVRKVLTNICAGIVCADKFGVYMWTKVIVPGAAWVCAIDAVYYFYTKDYWSALFAILFSIMFKLFDIKIAVDNSYEEDEDATA